MIIELVHPITQARAFARAASVQRAQAAVFAATQDAAWFQATGDAHREDGFETALFVQIIEPEKPVTKRKRRDDPLVTDSADPAGE